MAEIAEIPADIQRKVGEVLGPWDERMNRPAYNALSLGVARAILAERERCAKVAEVMEALSVESSEWDAGYRVALDAVASAIRNPPTNTEETK